jgi:hypothetical protein
MKAGYLAQNAGRTSPARRGLPRSSPGIHARRLGASSRRRNDLSAGVRVALPCSHLHTQCGSKLDDRAVRDRRLGNHRAHSLQEGGYPCLNPAETHVTARAPRAEHRFEVTMGFKATHEQLPRCLARARRFTRRPAPGRPSPDPGAAAARRGRGARSSCWRSARAEVPHYSPTLGAATATRNSEERRSTRRAPALGGRSSDVPIAETALALRANRPCEAGRSSAG